VGTSQIESLASSGFPTVFLAATPSADFNYSRPTIAINSWPVTLSFA
jgi:hypothetical protein